MKQASPGPGGNDKDPSANPTKTGQDLSQKNNAGTGWQGCGVGRQECDAQRRNLRGIAAALRNDSEQVYKRLVQRAKQDAPARRYLSIKEAADMIGIHRRTLWRWVERGWIPIRYFGPKVARVDVKEMLIAFEKMRGHTDDADDSEASGGCPVPKKP